MRCSACFSVCLAVWAFSGIGCGAEDPASTSSDGPTSGTGSGNGSTTTTGAGGAGGTAGVGGSQTTAPNAPESLGLMLMGTGIHVSWMDVSNDEDNFIVERKANDGTFEEVISLPFDTTQLHDAPLQAGTTYTYRVGASNAAGEAWSAEAVLLKP